ncbi:hypothetical protein Taro_035339, partial [Colocasia esculenta]|nr:hypothetical protein [Colocasia esculenta]
MHFNVSFFCSLSLSSSLEREALVFCGCGHGLPWGLALPPSASPTSSPQAPTSDHPSPLPSKSYARALADAPLFAPVSIAVHPLTFTDLGEPAVFFSSDEIAATLKPLQFAIVAKTPYGRPPFQEIKHLLQQRLNLGHDFIIATMDNRHLLLRCTSEDDYLCLLLRGQLLVKENIGRVLQVALRTSQITNVTAAYACVKLDLLKDRPSRVWIGMGFAASSCHDSQISTSKVDDAGIASTAVVPDLTRQRWTPKKTSHRDAGPSGMQGHAFDRSGKDQSLVAERLLGAAPMGPSNVAAGGASAAEALPCVWASSPPTQGKSALLGQNPTDRGGPSILGAQNPHNRSGISPIGSLAGPAQEKDALNLHPPEESIPPIAAAIVGYEQGTPVMLGFLSTKVGSFNQATQEEVEPIVGNTQTSIPAAQEVASTCEPSTLPVSTQVHVEQNDQVEESSSGRATAAGDSHTIAK